MGDDLFARLALRNPETEPEIYAAAVDLLPSLEGPPARVSGGGAELEVKPYDMPTLLREAALARDWWAPAAGGKLSDDAAAEYDALVSAACAEVAEDRSALVLRDYHAENLLWLPERRGAARIGLLDFQDALAGSPAYDLVSLLEDARRDTSAELREAMIRRRIAHGGLDAEAFRFAYSALGAQRNLKIVGIFARLMIRDGKPHYLRLIPRVWDHLMRDLSHPELAPLARFVEKHIPAPEPAILERLKEGAL